MTDFTNRYNTKLSLINEAMFQKWVQDESKKKGHDISKDLYDYDLRGAFLDGAKKASNGHLTDKYKKPNHPTFSNESKYNGIDGYRGGKWTKTINGQWMFNATDTNVKMMGADDLKRYFSNVEGGNILILPTNKEALQ